MFAVVPSPHGPKILRARTSEPPGDQLDANKSSSVQKAVLNHSEGHVTARGGAPARRAGPNAAFVYESEQQHATYCPRRVISIRR